MATALRRRAQLKELFRMTVFHPSKTLTLVLGQTETHTAAGSHPPREAARQSLCVGPGSSVAVESIVS